MYRYGSAALTLAVILAVISSCGGGDGDILASGNGITVTVDDFRAEFDRLTPEGQVMVLERGGRMDLVTMILNRKMLLAEASASAPDGLEDWQDISATAWLSTAWLTTEFDSMNVHGMDSLWIDSLLSTGISLTAVLMDDSAEAAQLIAAWEADGPSEPSEGMALAPWTLNGSSFIELEGDLFHFLGGDPAFARASMPMADMGFVQIPLFGEWIVFSLDTRQIETGGFDLAAMAQGFASARIGAKMPVTVYSAAVADLAGHLAPADGRYLVRDEESIDRGMILASFPGGTVTADRILDLFRMVTPENFFDGVPEELGVFTPPMPMIDPRIDLWMFVGNVGSTSYQAALAREAGNVFPREEVELTTTEHLLRVAALEEAAALDTADALRFYEENKDYYTLPELRSVLLAYVPEEWLPTEPPASFDDLERYYSTTDSLGQMIPTPPRPMEIFGPTGMAIFAAGQGEFTGPVEMTGTDLHAWFEVVEIVPPGAASPDEILPLLLRDCRLSTIGSDLDAYFEELRTRFDVEIDSSAVEQVDPWATTY